MPRIALILMLVACRPAGPASQSLSHVAAPVAAKPVVVLDELDEASALAVGDDGVYVAAKGKLVRAADRREFPVEAGGALSDLVVAGRTAYVVDTYRLIAVPLDGAAPRDLLEVHAFEATLAGDRAGLVWGTSVPNDETGKLFAAAHGGAPSELAGSIAHAQHVVVDGDRAYWVSRDGIFGIARSGGAMARLAPRTEDTGSQDLAVRGGMLFAATADGIVAVPTRGGGVRRLVERTDDDTPTLVAVDDVDVYYVNVGATTTSVRRIPRAGGTGVTLAEDVGTVVAIAVDRDAVYWLTGRQLVRLAK